MNRLLWALQIMLAFYHVTGGFFTISHYDQIKSAWASDLPPAVWVGIGILQILFALGLVLPGIFGKKPNLISVSALYLALYSLSGCALFAQYSGFPGVLWAVVPATLAAIIFRSR
jgi:hypothetical protein